jgi:FkbM family methyltransferase
MGSVSLLNAVSRIMRALPDGMPGKSRLARLALRSFIADTNRSIRDKFGNDMLLPSLREPISLGIFASGAYEPDTLSAILAHLPASGVFLDVGANIGAIALPIAAQRPQANIVCVEADHQIASVLCQNALNNHRYITIVECVAGAESGSVPFFPTPIDKFGMGSIGPQFATSCDVLQQRTLDDLLDELHIDHVDVAKLDIEGAEYGALCGLHRRLTSPSPPRNPI